MKTQNILAAAAGLAVGYMAFREKNAAVAGKKYTYYKVIQQNWGYGWDDVDYHETDSSYWPKDRQLFKGNLKAYRENQPGVPLRVINRKEKNAAVGSVYSKLRYVEVTYSTGDVIGTSMAAHLSDEDIYEYFKLGKVFNIGDGPKDKLAKVIDVNIIN